MGRHLLDEAQLDRIRPQLRVIICSIILVIPHVLCRVLLLCCARNIVSMPLLAKSKTTCGHVTWAAWSGFLLQCGSHRQPEWPRYQQCCSSSASYPTQVSADEELDEAAPQQAVRGSRLTPAVTLSALLAATVLCWLFLA